MWLFTAKLAVLQLHRSCMVTTVVLNIAAFIIIFIEVEGYSEVRKSVIYTKKTSYLYFSHYVKKYIGSP